MKTKKILKKTLKLILILTLMGFSYAIGVSTYEAILKHHKLEEFKSRAYETTEVEHYGDKHFYHAVKRTHSWELEDERNVFYNNQKTSAGKKGDVLLAFESPFPQIPVAHQMITFLFGGHAALVDDHNELIESSGMGSGGVSLIMKVILHRGYDEENTYKLSVQRRSNNWMTPYRDENSPEYPYYGEYYRSEFYAVRPKFEDQSTKNDDINKAIEYASDKVGKGLYNFLFFLDTKYKFYCTDLITRAYHAVNSSNDTNYNLNEDGFIASDYDILLSNDVYITIYREKKDDGIHIYYLEDIEN